jgi:hypothetical protein
VPIYSKSSKRIKSFKDCLHQVSHFRGCKLDMGGGSRKFVKRYDRASPSARRSFFACVCVKFATGGR